VKRLALILLLVLAGPAQAMPAKEKPKKLDGNAEINFKGVGPIKLGMGIGAARKAARTGISEGKEITKGCRQDTVLPRRFGLTTLRYKQKIRVLYVTRTAMPTAKGVRVNDSLQRLQAKYGSKLQERGSDVSATTRIFELHSGNREIQFQVDERERIIQISTGLHPEIDFSEGCA
jgi:hypothetical protein